MRVYLAGETKPKVMLGVNLDDTGGLELAGVDGGELPVSPVRLFFVASTPRRIPKEPISMR